MRNAVKVDANNRGLGVITKWFRDKFTLSVLDIAIAGALCALYLVIDLLFKRYLPKWINVQSLYFFSIVFGIFYGPYKGAVIAVIADTISLIITGRIAYWLPHYALIWPIVAIFSGAISNLMRQSRRLIIPYLLLTCATIGLTVYTLVAHNHQERIVLHYFLTQIGYTTIIIIAWISIAILWSSLIASTLLYYRMRSIPRYADYYLHLCYSIGIIACVYILSRWMWDPYAYSVYIHRFININREVSYYAISAGIIIKSVLVIPISIMVLSLLLNILLIFRKKYEHREMLLRLVAEDEKERRD